MPWYQIKCRECHRGGKSRQDQYVYAFSGDIIGALSKYKNTGGVQRNKRNEIRPLNEEEASFLEKKLAENGRNLSKAKENYKAIRV